MKLSKKEKKLGGKKKHVRKTFYSACIIFSNCVRKIMPFGFEQQSVDNDTVCDIKIEELSDIEIKRKWTQKVRSI